MHIVHTRFSYSLLLYLRRVYVTVPFVYLHTLPSIAVTLVTKERHLILTYCRQLLYERIRPILIIVLIEPVCVGHAASIINTEPVALAYSFLPFLTIEFSCACEVVLLLNLT